MWQRLDAEAYLMRPKNSRGLKLLLIAQLAA
jgi:hypothetical protein